MRDRVLATVARAAFALPGPLLRALAGGGRVTVDGQTLAPEVQLALRLLALRGGRPPIELADMTAARRAHAAATRMFRHAGIALASVTRVTIPTAAGPLEARLYAPDVPTPAPLLVYFHGGGFVFGDLDTHEPICRRLARDAGVRVLAVAYPLAPERPFPAGIDGALAAFRFAAAQATALGADARRLAVGGDSAGGNLAAVVAQELRAAAPAPAFQLLLYPVTDLSRRHASYELFGEGFYFGAAQMARMRAHYLPDDAAGRDPRASPLLATDLRGVAPAYVATAGFDILRDEAEAYAERLRAAGVTVTVRRFTDQVHGFAGTAPLFPSARAAMREVAQALRAGLSGGRG